MLGRYLLLVVFLLIEVSGLWAAKLPEIDQKRAAEKFQEIMRQHASQKMLTPELMERVLGLYLEQLDPSKSYLIQDDLAEWLKPTPEQLKELQEEYETAQFLTFEKIYQVMVKAIERRRELEKQIPYENLPQNVHPEEFKEMEWAKSPEELLERLTRMRTLQIETAQKLIGEGRETTLQRVAKSQNNFESNFLQTDPQLHERHLLTHLLKASTAALDTHSSYFTPDEARQFLIQVQQRLFGIGAQLRDDLRGLVVMKIVDGGPAAQSKELKLQDRIIAVDGQPIVGMDISEAVELIRGPEGTPVELTIVRETATEEGSPSKEEKLHITIVRGEVVIQESRYESEFIPLGRGGIAYLRLHSFYQDPDHSSASDLLDALQKMQKEHNIYGVILDLRSNAGGMLTQAVSVAGLFINKGIIVSIKDEQGEPQHLRQMQSPAAWAGPLILLVNRSSASSSEIVAQALQDYGRALIIGDDHTFGKGSFQVFTLSSDGSAVVNPEGEYKVTRGRYYTVSGKTPQLEGVLSDIVIPGGLSELEIGEKYQKYPLESDSIPPNYVDELSDVPFLQRARLRLFYRQDQQQKLPVDAELVQQLKKNSSWRIEHNKNYQAFLKELKKKAKERSEEQLEEEEEDRWGQNDLQLTEAINVMQDLIILKGITCPVHQALAETAKPNGSLPGTAKSTPAR